MAESITLQTSDSNVQQSDVLGRLSFAASNESNTSDARLIGATIHAEAEGEFTEISNPTSIVFSTASSESATGKLKITSSGNFIPLSNKIYDIGSVSLKFRNIYNETNYPDKIVLTSGSQPSSTENTLYNLSGILHYDTKAVALLPSGGLQNQILQKVSDTSYDLQWINNFATEVNVYVKNITGSGLLKGQAVYINGAQGDHPTITLAQATSDTMSSKTLGLLKQDLANNEFGYVVSEGILTSIDTSSAGSAGDAIWLSPSTPGGLVYGLANKPSAPDHMVFIGYVLRKQLNEGIIYIKPQNGFELEELHDVRIKSLSNNDILTYNSSSGVWANTTNPSGSLNNSIVTVSGMFVSGSGALNGGISTNATNITTVSGMFVSGSGALNNYINTHTHTSSQITDFNSSVSGLLPIKALTAGTNIQITSSTGNYTISSTGTGGSSLVSYTTASSFPSSGSSTSIYLATDSGRIYQWNNSSYSEIGPIGNGDLSLWNLFIPGAPTSVSGLSGGSVGDGKINLLWTAPSFIGVPITDYVIQYSTNSGTSWTTYNDGTSTSTSATITNLFNGSGYIFRVAAVNSIGQGSYSNNSSSISPVASDPYYSNVSLLLTMDGSDGSTTFTDSGPVGHIITAVGDSKISSTQSKFGGSSLYLDGNGDYLSVPSHTSLSLGTGNFTIEFWAYCTDQTNSYPGYISSQGGWNSGAYGIRYDNNGNQKWGFWINPSDPLMTSSSTYSFNTWRHIALVRQSGTWRLYVDGVQACSSTTQGTDSLDLAYGGTMRIGYGTWDGSAGYVKDYIDCLRITKGVCRFPDGTTFTPSTIAFPAY